MELFSVFGRIGLDSKDFDRGIADSERSGQGFGASFGKVAAGIAKAGAAIGVAVSGGDKGNKCRKNSRIIKN